MVKGARLYRTTVEVIQNDGDVLAEGERATRIFNAARNLRAFDCPPALALALLEEPALDSGLSPSEARNHILNGVRKDA